MRPPVTDLLYAGFLGLVAGLLPVYLGLAPLPLFKRLSPGWRTILLGFSAGILLFLFADVTMEAVETSTAAGSHPLLFAVGLVLGLLGPAFVAHWQAGKKAASGTAKRTGSAKMLTAYTISMGIGLHNLGEGLAIGAAYAGGTLALTTLLVIGFFLHNSTEGLGMTAPIMSVKTGWREPLLLGFLAGFPTIIGSMIGSLSNAAALATLFFAAAAGALLYVIMELVRLAYTPDRMRNAFVGIVAGILVMYFTGLLVP